MEKIRVKLVRSRIGSSPHQRKMLDALGLRKTNSAREFDDTQAIRGIIEKVCHMVKVEKLGKNADDAA